VKRFVRLALVVVPFVLSLALGSAFAAGKPAAKTAKTAAPVDSLELLQRAVARDSTKWENLYRLGLLLMDRDRPQEAMRVMAKASRVRPGHVPTLVNLGAAYDALGQPASAQASYREALKIAPDDTVATCRLASSLYSTSDYPRAMDLLRGLIAKNPSAYCAYFTLGVAFADAGIYRDAIRMWEKVVALAPTSSEAMSAKESIDVLKRVLDANNPFQTSPASSPPPPPTPTPPGK
jgi:tetratricopeptide (TPR) repeat protein